MPKDASYHKAAIRYNEELAVFAENLAKKLDNDEIKRWARSVSRQHKLHAGHHRKALKRLKNSFRGRKNQEEKNLTEETPKSIEQEQADFAARMEEQNIAGGGGSADPEDNAPELVPAGVGTDSDDQVGGVTA
jgi:hypothetical protein